VTSSEIEVWNHRLAQVAEEMGLALQRAALSPNIKERRDYSCALFDGDGRLIAQAAHIPVHLGSTATAVRAVLERVSLADGEHAIVNDPYAGGTHLPDVTLVAPVFFEGARIGIVACRAHHADVGGAAPGSMPVGVRPLPSDDALPEAEPLPAAVGPEYALPPSPSLEYRAVTIDEEGVRLQPQKLTDEGVRQFAAATRAPDERRGDLEAQRAALEVGRRRLIALAERFGAASLRAHGEALIGYTARLLRARIAELPDGVYAFADSLDDGGAGGREVAIRVTLTIAGARATVDFSDSDDEVEGPLNAVYAVTLASVLYAFRLLLPEDTPTNEGLLAPLTVVAPEGTVLNAQPPRAVAAGNVETSQRVVDVVLGALSQAMRVPAASAGTMSNLLVGGAGWAYYETIAGGAGASIDGDGASAIQTHMTNTRSTPVEVLEHALPVRVRRYAVRRGSGGGGTHRGGDGVIRELELLADATVTLVGERRRRPPYGLGGGGPGAPGADWLERGERRVHLPGKITFAARKGDVVTVETPGGGGFGDEVRAKFWSKVLSGTLTSLDD
jgi:N-methylhydantoinase B